LRDKDIDLSPLVDALTLEDAQTEFENLKQKLYDIAEGK
jgi:hypothetical protein